MNPQLNIKQYIFYYDLRSLPFVEAIWLYGSRARQDNIERSDIDLAILCPQATEEEWRKIQEIIENANTLLHIDIVRFDALSENDKIRYNILKDKVVLFERKPNSYPWYDSFLDLSEALEKLQEMVQEPEMEKSYVKDATIQRFEFCAELFWKTLKKICIEEEYDVDSPKEVLEKSFQLKLIDDAPLWTLMIKDRNKTSHIYNWKLSTEIYYRIKSYYDAMQKAFNVIKEKYDL